MEDPGLSRCPRLPEGLSRSSDGVRRRPWALDMSPERDWKAETGLKQKYSLRKKLFQKGIFFPLGSISLGKVVFNFLALLFSDSFNDIIESRI